MAWQQGHAGQVGYVPGGNDETPRVRIVPNLVEHLAYLVDVPSVRRRPGAPLIAVNRAQIAFFVRPFVPDRHPVVLEVTDIGFPFQEPQELVNDGFEVHLLGGEQRKSRSKIEAHLRAENGKRSGAGAVVLARAVLQHVVHQIEVLMHDLQVRARRLAAKPAKILFYCLSERPAQHPVHDLTHGLGLPPQKTMAAHRLARAGLRRQAS